jgi:signal transduction histidine kinase
LQPVLDTIARDAALVCGATDGVVHLVEGGELPVVAHYGLVGGIHAAPIRRFPLTSGSVVGRAVIERRTIQVEDASAIDEAEFPLAKQIARQTGHRTGLATPLLREGNAIGALVIRRLEVRPFTEKQIALLQTFADQAVIAIENVRLFNELEAANRELAAASQHKSEFLANMSHELRTPLNAIIGYSELLEEEATDVDGGRLLPDLQKIAVAAKHQLSLINDILDLSKVEAGRMELELTAFDLDTAIDNALTLVRERASRRGIVLGRAIDEPLGTIRADERKVKQVLLNLLSNALKFTPEGGRIKVRAVMNEELAEISVADTGAGIAPEDQEAIFEEFRQVGTADKKVEGTGLGLALSRKFIELHGGRIWVKSQVGQGSTFTFTLPARREQ